LDEIPAHARVLVRGMGLNYFDVQTLLTIERGGSFVDAGTSDGAGTSDAGASAAESAAESDAWSDNSATSTASGTVRYLPSGKEPALFLGSRRGIPYRSKPISHEHPRSAWPLRYFTKEN
ncbi:UNVERIFIED_CONTAM: hypothetical protein IGO34_25520, partial [Salmonella enterica subsp. enterica serovar Weltevreden]